MTVVEFESWVLRCSASDIKHINGWLMLPSNIQNNIIRIVQKSRSGVSVSPTSKSKLVMKS
jgi:hypothetical protein